MVRRIVEANQENGWSGRGPDPLNGGPPRQPRWPLLWPEEPQGSEAGAKNIDQTISPLRRNPPGFPLDCRAGSARLCERGSAWGRRDSRELTRHASTTPGNTGLAKHRR